MHSVGRSSEPGDPVRGAVAQADPVVAAPQVGNRALAQPAAGAQPASSSLSLDDPSSNPTRAHDLLRAIDAEQYTYAMKGSALHCERRLNDLLDILADRTGRNP